MICQLPISDTWVLLHRLHFQFPCNFTIYFSSVLELCTYRSFIFLLFRSRPRCPLIASLLSTDKNLRLYPCCSFHKFLLKSADGWNKQRFSRVYAPFLRTYTCFHSCFAPQASFTPCPGGVLLTMLPLTSPHPSTSIFIPLSAPHFVRPSLWPV